MPLPIPEEVFRNLEFYVKIINEISLIELIQYFKIHREKYYDLKRYFLNVINTLENCDIKTEN